MLLLLDFSICFYLISFILVILNKYMVNFLNIFRYLFERPNNVPKYYFDRTLSYAEKLKKDLEMVGNDFKKFIK